MRESPDLVGENVTACKLATRTWAQQVLQEVLYNILGLHRRPPDLARTLEEIESLQVQHMGAVRTHHVDGPCECGNSFEDFP
ncbi:hypothetical protein GQ457_13G014540 [Hibiscus cannabinus]